MGILQLDIACGKNKRPGFTGVDIWEGADIVCNLEEFPWPFDDCSVDDVFCSHYIEHTPDLVSFANEIYRIMKVGAKAEIIAPYYSSIRAWQDPTHLRAISENTFLYFSKDWRETNKLDHYPITADFDVECRYIIDAQWRDKDESELQFAIRHYINVVTDIHVTLIKKKYVSDEVLFLLNQATLHWNNGEFNEANSLCEKILGNEDNQEAFVMVGEYSMKKEDFEDAIAKFRNAVELDIRSFEAHAGLVRALVASGRKGDAKRHVEELGKYDADIAALLEIFFDK